MPITIEELMESAARGVLRAMDARLEGETKFRGTTPQLVQSGFNVDIAIRGGGSIAGLTPQLPRGGALERGGQGIQDTE